MIHNLIFGLLLSFLQAHSIRTLKLRRRLIIFFSLAWKLRLNAYQITVFAHPIITALTGVIIEQIYASCRVLARVGLTVIYIRLTICAWNKSTNFYFNLVMFSIMAIILKQILCYAMLYWLHTESLQTKIYPCIQRGTRMSRIQRSLHTLRHFGTDLRHTPESLYHSMFLPIQTHSYNCIHLPEAYIKYPNLKRTFVTDDYVKFSVCHTDIFKQF